MPGIAGVGVVSGPFRRSLGLLAVGQGEALFCRPGQAGRIPFDRILRNHIGDFLPILKFLQVLEGPCPPIRLIQRHRLDDLTIFIQVDRNGIRPLTVGIVPIIPDLRDLDLGLLRGDPSIGDGKTSAWLPETEAV